MPIISKVEFMHSYLFQAPVPYSPYSHRSWDFQKHLVHLLRAILSQQLMEVWNDIKLVVTSGCDFLTVSIIGEMGGEKVEESSNTYSKRNINRSTNQKNN